MEAERRGNPAEEQLPNLHLANEHFLLNSTGPERVR